MHAADPAGRQHLDARGRGDLDGRGDGRATERTRGEDRRDIADRHFGDATLVREPLEQHLAGADDGDAVVQRDRGRHDAERADLRLERLRGGEVSWTRQAMRDDRRLECHDG